MTPELGLRDKYNNYLWIKILIDSWNEKKKEIHNRKSLLFAEREIWWCDLGLNIGDEQDGKNNGQCRIKIEIRNI